MPVGLTLWSHVRGLGFAVVHVRRIYGGCVVNGLRPSL